MALTYSTIYQGQLSNSAAVLYTVPASTTLLITGFKIHNTDSSNRTVTIRFVSGGGTGADANQLYELTVLPNETIELDNCILATGYAIVGFASVTSVVNVLISGVLKT